MSQEIVKDKILREVYRNYRQFKEYVRTSGNHTLVHRGITISFFDLDQGIESLSPRKKQAFYLNVIEDRKQREVAEMMGITTVSVGQYVQQAMIELAKIHFKEENEQV